MNPMNLIKTDGAWPRISAALILSLSLTACNDGGIVGTGSGSEPAADKQPTEIAESPAAAGASLSSLPSAEKQRQICNSIPPDAPASLLGLAATLSVTLENDEATAFSCIWQPISTSSGSTSGRVSITIDSNPALWKSVITDSSGKYLGPSRSVLNNGYIVHSADECRSGIVIPPENGLTLTLDYENLTACRSGTDHQPDVVLESLNQLGRDTLETLRQILK